MIVWIKKILFRILPQKTYLKTLHRAFYLLYNLGLLKKDERFKYHYLIKNLIETDFTVVDIGANLGYFSKNFAKLTPKGKVISIEPVKTFYEVLSHFMRKYPNAQVFNYALGTENGKITMVLPESNGMIRTGLPHIAQSEEEKLAHKTHEVPLIKGSELLADLNKIDYIKCDIEGYEVVVFKEIKALIDKHRPMVQIEIGPENEKTMLDYFLSLGYIQYGVSNFKVIRESGEQQEQGDFLFVHSDKAAAFESRMSKLGLFH